MSCEFLTSSALGPRDADKGTAAGRNADGPPSCKNRRMDEDEQRIRGQLMVVDALVRAIDRRDEVFQVIEDSEDEDEAIRRVGQLLGVD